MSNWGRIGVFDLETTGVDVDTSRVVSACVAVLEPDGRVVARWDWLADPGIEIPEGASAVHGITTERARLEGRPAPGVIAEITQTLRTLFGLGMPVVVYNAPYDFTLLDRECRRYGLDPITDPSPVIDPLVLDKVVDRFRKGKRTLEVTTGVYGVVLDDAHDAGADAIAAGRVAQALVRAYPDDLALPLADLHGRQAIWYAEQAASFQDYIRRVKGDETFVAEDDWPIRPIDGIGALEDTQPFAAPARRPSLTIPTLDLDTGVLAIQPQLVDAVFELEAPSALEPVVVPIVEPVVPPVVEPVVPPVVEPIVAPAPAPVEQNPGMPATTIGAGAARRPTVLRVAAGILTDGAGRTLVVRKRGTSAFMQAGGKIEEGESALDALARELREEIGLELDLDATEYLGSHRAVAANEPNTVIRAEVFAVAVAGEVVASNEIEELLWLEATDLDAVELAPLTRDTILPLWIGRRSALF